MAEIVEPRSSRKRLYFLWDYDLGEEEFREILKSGAPLEKGWLITRILEYAKWDDIWRLLTIADIEANFEYLRFRRAQDRDLWRLALDRWSVHG